MLPISLPVPDLLLTKEPSCLSLLLSDHAEGEAGDFEVSLHQAQRCLEEMESLEELEEDKTDDPLFAVCLLPSPLAPIQTEWTPKPDGKPETASQNSEKTELVQTVYDPIPLYPKNQPFQAEISNADSAPEPNPNPEADPMTTPFVSEKQKEVSGPIAPSPKFADLSESIPAPIKKSEDNPFISRAPFISDATINLTDQGTRSETSDSLSEKSGWPGPYEEKAKTEIKPQAETIQAPTQKNMALLSDSASIEMENPIDALADAMIYHRTSKQNETLIVRLKPDHLGCVQLHLQQKDEKIIITIRTDNHRTGQLLKHQTEAIESALLARGFSDTQVILQLDENAAIGNGSAGHLPSGYSNGWTSNGEPNRQKQNDWTPFDPRPVEQEKPILIRTRKYALIDKMA